jgi:hypothetical protein
MTWRCGIIGRHRAALPGLVRRGSPTLPKARPQVSAIFCRTRKLAICGGVVRRPRSNREAICGAWSGDRAPTGGQETAPQQGVRRPRPNRGSGDRAPTGGQETAFQQGGAWSGDRAPTGGQETAFQQGVRRPRSNRGSGDRVPTGGQETAFQQGVRRHRPNRGSGDRAPTGPNRKPQHGALARRQCHPMHKVPSGGITTRAPVAIEERIYRGYSLLLWRMILPSAA